MTDRSYTWGPDVYDLAFELWAFVLDESVGKVVERLTMNGYPVPRRTVHYWIEHHDWKAKKLARLGRDVPGLHRMNLAHLAYGSTEGFRTLREIVRHDRPEVSPAHNRNRIAAAVILIDRAGYAPRHVAASDQRRPSIAEVARDIELSDEEIAADILGYYGETPALPVESASASADSA